MRKGWWLSVTCQAVLAAINSGKCSEVTGTRGELDVALGRQILEEELEGTVALSAIELVANSTASRLFLVVQTMVLLYEQQERENMKAQGILEDNFKKNYTIQSCMQ